MVGKVNVRLGEIQETLLITLWSRAVELHQPDPILRDLKSAEIVQAIAYDFEKFTAAKSSQIGCCLRGVIFDDWVKTYLKAHPRGTVVEIGAGLNTRFERVDNGQARWFELDLPDSMALRRQFFEETDRRRFLTASVFETDWMEVVKAASSEPPIFLAEGVLMYLPKNSVQQIFTNLAQHFPGCWFAFDSMAPLMARRKHQAVKYTSARFDWAIANIRQIETWGDHYRIHDICTFADLPQRIPIQHYRRFSRVNRMLFALPYFRDLYRLALVRLGQSQNAETAESPTLPPG
jgi:O-methyltransferase involved in polyketide biosynthesis